MKASELRPGNIIDKKFADSGGFQWSFFRHTEYADLEKYPDNYRPTKLTKEWLVKFGFKRDKGRNNLPIMRFGGLYVYMDDFTITYMGNILPTNGYVHELQNAFYVLYGKELTSTPPHPL
nr:hypothetical protein [uncultured Flavobacterium sp.]